MDRAAIRAREDRRDPRHRQHVAAIERDRLSAAAERGGNARDDWRLPRHRLHRGARESRRLRRPHWDARAHHLYRRGKHSAGSDSVLRRLRARRAGERGWARCAEPVGRRRRRHQHAVHVGDDRLPQRRHALEPQHRQQRRGARTTARLHAGRSFVPLRPPVPLLRLRDRRPRRLHARRMSLRRRGVRSQARA